MPKSRERRYKRPPREQLTELRKTRYPGMTAEAFAEKLGVCRMHMTSVEVGRRDPSIELALRWMELLGVGIEVFDPLPALETYVRDLKRLAAINPELCNQAA